MRRAADEDRDLNKRNQPAVRKVSMLKRAMSQLIKKVRALPPLSSVAPVGVRPLRAFSELVRGRVSGAAAAADFTSLSLVRR